MQAVYAVYQEEKVRQRLSRRFDLQFSAMEECLIWAGKPNTLGGQNCINGVVVLHELLSELGG